MKDYYLLPSIFVLFPNNTEITFRRMWQQVQLLRPLVNPTEILMDFEKTVINNFQLTHSQALWLSSKHCFLSYAECMAQGAGSRIASCTLGEQRARYSYYNIIISDFCSSL